MVCLADVVEVDRETYKNRVILLSRLLVTTAPIENRMKSQVEARKDRKELWFLTPTQLLIHGQ